jgi:hypothetical protein
MQRKIDPPSVRAMRGIMRCLGLIMKALCLGVTDPQALGIRICLPRGDPILKLYVNTTNGETVDVEVPSKIRGSVNHAFPSTFQTILTTLLFAVQ